MSSSGDPGSIDAEQFDYMAPELGADLHERLAGLRASCPVAHSAKRDGYWVVTRYADVVRVAKDWASFSSAHGVAPGTPPMPVKAIPEHVDPPLHRVYKRLINVWFTPQAVAPLEQATRALVTELIDRFIHAGRCELMSELARPFPGRAFFQLVLGAPPDEAAHVTEIVMNATALTNPDSKAAWLALIAWIERFLEKRRAEPRRNDVVDAVLHAEIEGRPITHPEVVGIVQLLLLGGLDTTAGTLGTAMIRFCEQPELFARLYAEPQRIPDAVEELLRLDGPFVAIGRTALVDVELGGEQIKAGDKVLIYWASANRDAAEFPEPERFDLDRPNNRHHVAFGSGPHACAGLNLARMNLRIAIEQLVRRLEHVTLEPTAQPIRYHSGLTRFPLTVPIVFSARRGA